MPFEARLSLVLISYLPESYLSVYLMYAVYSTMSALNSGVDRNKKMRGQYNGKSSDIDISATQASMFIKIVL